MNAYSQFNRTEVAEACDKMIAGLEPIRARARRDYAWADLEAQSAFETRFPPLQRDAYLKVKTHLEFLQRIEGEIRDAKQIKHTALATQGPLYLDSKTAARLGLLSPDRFNGSRSEPQIEQGRP